MFGSLSTIYKLTPGISKRVSSYDRSGGNNDWIPVDANAEAILGDISGPGVIRHIWLTFKTSDPMARRFILLYIYWDDEVAPSVLSPLGDFFGQGWGEQYNYLSLPLSAAPQQGRALNCYFPMPFQKRARIVIQNDSDVGVEKFYYCIDYEQCEIDKEDTGYFHAWWNREITTPEVPDQDERIESAYPLLNTSVENNYLIADIEGQGHFSGVHMYIDNPSPIWYGEGDDMWLIDGETKPSSIHGTGTEDFFNTAWCPNELYNHPYFGCARSSREYGWMGRHHFYRFFIEDPIRFSRSLHVSVEHGHGNALELDMASVAYWYQQEPHKAYDAICTKEFRQNSLSPDLKEVHAWRCAYQSDKGGPIR